MINDRVHINHGKKPKQTKKNPKVFNIVMFLAYFCCVFAMHAKMRINSKELRSYAFLMLVSNTDHSRLKIRLNVSIKITNARFIFIHDNRANMHVMFVPGRSTQFHLVFPPV